MTMRNKAEIRISRSLNVTIYVLLLLMLTQHKETIMNKGFTFFPFVYLSGLIEYTHI